ncbi:unnamed protein product [Protopolystoma xenopodis]|uniref:Uncharacterized protein n=1 Tax=Protopolystoma xenopodis TaxID=117903 RepID=A0A3S5AKU1_9PLAT|nr:unnamed protein product [Protopolystoma xenopodis]
MRLYCRYFRPRILYLPQALGPPTIYSTPTFDQEAGPPNHQIIAEYEERLAPSQVHKLPASLPTLFQPNANNSNQLNFVEANELSSFCLCGATDRVCSLTQPPLVQRIPDP